MSIRDELIAALGDQRLQIAQAMGESGCASGCHSTIVAPPFHLMTHEELVQTATLLYGVMELNKKGIEPERGECRVEAMNGYTDAYVGTRWYVELSCHTLDAWEDEYPPRYCPYCGRKVVGE